MCGITIERKQKISISAIRYVCHQPLKSHMEWINRPQTLEGAVKTFVGMERSSIKYGTLGLSQMGLAPVYVYTYIAKKK